MLDKETEKRYNEMCNACLVNVYTISKEQKTIILLNFDPKNIDHLFLYEIAQTAASLFHFDLKIDTSLFSYLKFTVGKKRNCKRILHRKSLISHGVRADMMLEYVAGAFGESNNVWGKIYNEFYKKG